MSGWLKRASQFVSILFFSAATVLFLSASGVLAEVQKMSAPEALKALDDGQIVLLDIRSPQEWKQTGVARGAFPITMHNQEFSARLSGVIKANPDTPIALICATGGRTAYVTSVLEKNGVSGIIDVSEGMMGNPSGPGWIARKLPIVDAKAAKKAYALAIEN